MRKEFGRVQDPDTMEVSQPDLSDLNLDHQPVGAPEKSFGMHWFFGPDKVTFFGKIKGLRLVTKYPWKSAQEIL